MHKNSVKAEGDGNKTGSIVLAQNLSGTWGIN
jgi:hypothetical protein